MQIGLIPTPEASERRGRHPGIVSSPVDRAPLLARLCTYEVEKGGGVGSTEVAPGSGTKDRLQATALLRAGCETRAWSSGCWVRGFLSFFLWRHTSSPSWWFSTTVNHSNTVFTPPPFFLVPQHAKDL